MDTICTLISPRRSPHLKGKSSHTHMLTHIHTLTHLDLEEQQRVLNYTPRFHSRFYQCQGTLFQSIVQQQVTNQIHSYVCGRLGVINHLQNRLKVGRLYRRTVALLFPNVFLALTFLYSDDHGAVGDATVSNALTIHSRLRQLLLDYFEANGHGVHRCAYLMGSLPYKPL